MAMVISDLISKWILATYKAVNYANVIRTTDCMFAFYFGCFLAASSKGSAAKRKIVNVWRVQIFHIFSQ